MSNRGFYDDTAEIAKQGHGIFGDDAGGLAPAVGKVERPTASPTPNGVVMTLSCQYCGVPVQIVLEYAELVGVQYKIPPHVLAQRVPALKIQTVEWEWDRATNHFWPKMTCSCGRPRSVGITPQEAGRFLQVGHENGWIDKRGHAYAQQAAAAIAQELYPAG